MNYLSAKNNFSVLGKGAMQGMRTLDHHAKEIAKPNTTFPPRRHDGDAQT
jgi:hypothetical protein